MKKIVLSGIKPSGLPHLGNYFAMMEKLISENQDCENYAFIADLHALTNTLDAKLLKKFSFEIASSYISLGLDTKKTIFFRQSDIKEITELFWILTCVCPTSLLKRAHSYKDMVAKNKSVNCGVFTYPVLMSADILIYKTNIVPVGKDQKQHIEIARDIAINFNRKFGKDIFVLPKEKIDENVKTIIGTDGQKMSKSYNNTIGIFEDLSSVEKKIKKMFTDDKKLRKNDPGNPENCNIFAMEKLFLAKKESDEISTKCKSGIQGCMDCKKNLFSLFCEKFETARIKKKEIEKDKKYIEKILKRGAENARIVANKTIKEVRNIVGL